MSHVKTCCRHFQVSLVAAALNWRIYLQFGKGLTEKKENTRSKATVQVNNVIHQESINIAHSENTKPHVHTSLRLLCMFPEIMYVGNPDQCSQWPLTDSALDHRNEVAVGNTYVPLKENENPEGNSHNPIHMEENGDPKNFIFAYHSIMGSKWRTEELTH